MFKNYSSFQKKTEALKLSESALQALKEVARQTRHYKNPAGIVIFGKDGYFNRAADIKKTLTLNSDYQTIVDYAQDIEPTSNCALFAHGHLKGVILDSTDVCFDYRLLSSGDIADMVTCQKQFGQDFKFYTSCLGCDDLGNVQMQILSFDGTNCYQYTNLQADGVGRFPNDAFEDLIRLETVDAKF